MKNLQKTLVVGSNGQVGRALFKSMRKKYRILEHDIRDRELRHGDKIVAQVDPEKAQGLVMHIAIPYSDNFERIVKEYHKLYKPSLIIIHSTVKPGTTLLLNRAGISCVHSPAIFDENRFDTMTAYRKLIGYDSQSSAIEAEGHLRHCFNTALVAGSISTELSDICLALYVMTCRSVTFEISRIFDISGINYAAMRELIHSSNMGYATVSNTTNLLFNMMPELNKNDYRLGLMNLLPKDLVSAFFVCSEKSYQLEIQSREEKLKKGKADASTVEKVAV